MIKALLIDDEKKSVLTLQNLLKEFCPSVEVIGSANSVASGIISIETLKPELVFLDISMGDGDGFEVLKRVDRRHDFEVIFTTAHHQYAAKAFEFAALHYLLKPINIDELIQAVARFSKIKAPGQNEQRFDILQKGLKNEFKRLAIPSQEGITFIEMDDIIRCEATDHYTLFYLKDKTRLMASKLIGKYELILEDFFFFRVHNKHLINLKLVKKYIKGKGGQVIMEDGFSAEVSTRKKEEFLQRIMELTGKF